MSRMFRSRSYLLVCIALVIGLPGLNRLAAATEPTQGGTVALAFDGPSRTLLKATTDALYRSDDDGRHWNQIKLPQGPDTRRIASVAAASGGKGVLYVAGAGLGVLRSNDGGASWEARNDGLPGNDVAAIATHADQPETVFAIVSGHGIYRSQNGGLGWKLMDAGPRGGIQRLMHSNMPGSMQTGWFFAATAKGVRRAMDCFCGWRDAGGLGSNVAAIAYDPRRPLNVFAATDTGLLLSQDGGEKWSHVNAPAARLTALVATPSGILYAAAADGSLFRSNDDAKTWERVNA